MAPSVTFAKSFIFLTEFNPMHFMFMAIVNGKFFHSLCLPAGDCWETRKLFIFL